MPARVLMGKLSSAHDGRFQKTLYGRSSGTRVELDSLALGEEASSMDSTQGGASQVTRRCRLGTCRHSRQNSSDTSCSSLVDSNHRDPLAVLARATRRALRRWLSAAGPADATVKVRNN